MRQINGISCAVAAATIIGCLAVTSLLQGQDSASADEIKAAMIFNFTKFIEWPADAPAFAGKEFVITVLGPPKVADAFEQALHQRVAFGRPVVVRNVQRADEIKPCHILVVCAREAKETDDALQSTRGKAVLTIGDGSQFTRRGGTIAFVLLDNRLNFQVNVEAARQSRLTISSKLLRLAQVKSD
ncbi:MAG: YfiR family protein [Bryobacteraceae bacterium]